MQREEQERNGFRPPRSIFAVLVRATYTAVILAVIVFFATTALSILAFAIYGLLTHVKPDFTLAYRRIGAPGAIGFFIGAWIYAFFLFRREQRRAATSQS
jgi:hypothetical protein